MKKTGPENTKTRMPLIEKLNKLGWDKKQIMIEPEWRVPKRPSEATKREVGKKFESYPVDVAIFDEPKNYGKWEHVRILIETKAPDINQGLSQLEIYLSLEPRAIAGYWTNGKEIAALYRTANGKFKEDKHAKLPKLTDNLLFPGEEPILWGDLDEVSELELKNKFKRLLDQIVVADTKSTRRDDQLNQLCNLLLVKLESDKRAKVNPNEPVIFQVWKDEKTTASKIEDFFKKMKLTHGDLFCSISDEIINLDKHTINSVAYELGKVKLVDTTVDSLSTAFQVLRSESLKSEEGQYFTPSAIIKSCVKLMDITYDDKIIDPACGTGAFLLECFKQFKDKHPSLDSSDAKSWAQQHLFGVDKDQINVKLTKAMLIILGDGSTHTYLGDSIRENLWPKTWPYLVSALKDESFTCIITNPPFGQKLKISALDGERAGLSICETEKNGVVKYESRELGLAFLERCHRLLIKGGRVGIILPETYFFSTSYLWFQDWLKDRFIVRGIVNIPMEAFQGFCRAKTNFYVMEKR